MAAKTKRSRKDKYKEEASLVFDSAKTYVEPHSTLHNRKPFSDVTVAVSAKELYIGNFRVKWENVLSLKVFTTPADPHATYDNGTPIEDTIEVDRNDGRWHREDCSFEVRCREHKQQKGDHCVSDVDYTGPVRVFDVVQPVGDGSSNNYSRRSSWIDRWQAFRQTLEECHSNELKKRQKKVQREKEAEEEHKKSLAKQRNNARSGFRRSTFASRKEAKWNAKNATNMRNNKDLTGYIDNDEEYDFLARAKAKKGKETSKETMKRLQEQENFNNDTFNENAAPRSDDIDSRNQNSNQEQEDGEEEWNDNATDLANSEETNDDDDAMEEDVLVDSSNEDESNEKETRVSRLAASKKKPAFRSRRKKRKTKALVGDDDDDDSDNEVFSSQQTFTTPSSQRVVSPGTTAGRKRKVIQDSDDEDDGGEDNKKGTSRADNKRGGATSTKNDKEDVAEGDEDKSMPKITNFFKKSGASKPANVTSRGKPSKSTSSANPLTPKRKEPELTQTSYDSIESDDSETEMTRAAKITESSDKASKFFQPRKSSINAAATYSSATKKASSEAEGGETPTVVGSPTPSKRKHAVDDESDDEGRYGTLSSKKYIGSQRRIGGEDPEDPIGEFDSSQSQSASGFKPAIFKKKSTKSKGMDALNFADLHTRDKSYTKAIAPGERPHAYTASQQKQLRVLSPHSSPAKRLNFDAHADDSSKWRGLQNDGNTCYMNSSLQALFSISQCMAAISPMQKGHELVHSLVHLWKQLNATSSCVSASARPVKAVIDKLTDRFVGSEQRDAHEFLGEVIDAIHEELFKDDDERDDDAMIVGPTDEWFRMEVEASLTCKSCGYHRKKQEMYRNLSLDIVHPPSDSERLKPSIESCLASFFQPEDREIKCEKCKEGEVATQQMKILSKPKALLLHLKRFIVEERPGNDENDPNGAATELIYRKNKAALNLDLNVSLENFLADSYKAKVAAKSSYSLKSIVYHHGNTASSGHYTADGLRDGTWVSFDDGKTHETDLEDIVGTSAKQKKAYMLMYSLD